MPKKSAIDSLNLTKHAAKHADEPDDRGVSEETHGHHSIKVTNADGYFCHITSEAILPCPPLEVFAILTNPDNSNVFRDIKARGFRKIVEQGPEGYRVVEIEQVGEIKILWKRYRFSTFLTVTEDATQEVPKTSFNLIRSDVLTKFQGTWTLNAHPNPKGSGSHTRAVLEQDLVPAGVPTFMAQMPVMKGVLRGICVRAVRRLLEDVELVIRKVQKGASLDKVLGLDKVDAECDEHLDTSKLDSHAIIGQFSDSDADDIPPREREQLKLAQP